MDILPGLPGGPPYVPMTVQQSRFVHAVAGITISAMIADAAYARWFYMPPRVKETAS